MNEYTEVGGKSDVNRIEIHRTDGHRTTLRNVGLIKMEVGRSTFEITKGPTLNDPGDIARRFISGPRLINLTAEAADIEEQIDIIEQRPRVSLVWDRVGDQGQDRHQLQPLDITEAIDMGRLHRMIENQVAIALHSAEWLVGLKIEVNLKGGPWQDLPFGYGHVRVDR